MVASFSIEKYLAYELDLETIRYVELFFMRASCSFEILAYVCDSLIWQSYLVIIANSDRRRGLEFDCNQEALFARDARTLSRLQFKLHLAIISTSVTGEIMVERYLPLVGFSIKPQTRCCPTGNSPTPTNHISIKLVYTKINKVYKANFFCRSISIYSLTEGR